MILRNIFSMSGLNALKAVVALVVSTVVAGAVRPDQFGLAAFAIPLVALLGLLTDLGLASAIIRHPDLDRDQAGAAVGFMALAGVVGGLALTAASGWIERTSGLHGLTPLLIGFALVAALSICATAPRALLERRLLYATVAGIEAAAVLIGLACFAIATRRGLGIFALLCYHVALQATRALAFCFTSRPLYRLNVRFGTITAVMQIGAWLFVSNLLSYAARNAGPLLIGSYLGAAAVGLFGLASQFMTAPLMMISWPVSGVLLSTLARMQGDTQRQADLIRAIMTATAAITFPLMTFLTFGVRFPIQMLYGHRWDGLADIVMLLAPIGAIQSIAAYNGAVLVQRGAVRLNFVLSVLNGVGVSAVFLLAVPLGLHAVVVAYCVSATLVSLLMIFFTCREAQISAARFLECMLPGTAASLAGVMCAWAATGLAPRSALEWLAASAIYAATVLVAFVVRRGQIAAMFAALTASAAGPLAARK